MPESHGPDAVARYNAVRWDALARADALYTRPYLDLDAASARERLDPEGQLGVVEGKRVLCLASGGGRQSAAFAVLGADVTVFDLSAAVLSRDREVAEHYGKDIRIEQGDMRDLSRFPAASFDLVWQPYSLNFVPDASMVFGEVAHVLKAAGMYHVMCANPFVAGMGTRDWTGAGYAIQSPYEDGVELIAADEAWVYRDTDGRGTAHTQIAPPHEYRHTLSTLVNGLSDHGFLIRHLTEHTHALPDATPGTWAHFTTVAPPWFTLWTTYQPEERPR